MSVRPPPSRPQSRAARAEEGPAQPTPSTSPAVARHIPRRADRFDHLPPRARATGPAEARPVADREGSGPRPLRVVVTGYGDFAGVYNEAEGRPNPSSVLGRQLEALGLQNAQVTFRHLEVTHDAVDAFLAELRENPPDLILSMGVSSRAQVEERPENWKSDAIDGQGRRITPGPISDAQPPRVRLATDLPVDAIERALSEAQAAGQLPGRTVGTDDGTRTGPDEDYFPDASAYLCNYLNFRLTEAFAQNDAVTAGFVHVTARTTPAEMQLIAQALVDHEVRRRQDAALPVG